jgi:hypothetical protein
MDGALRAAHAAQRMAPQDPQMYSQIAGLFMARDEGDEAAAALMEGMLITSDQGLRSYLVRLYGSLTDAGNCTLVPGPNGPAINPRCRIVRDHICAAAPDVLRSLMDMGKGQEAMRNKQAFLGEYQCAAGPLNQVFP